ncbi:MAG: phosphatidylserine decarboxylase [Elusimicrobiota bacterium]|jgi:phosphatidylserine decarboxylase|nr:phosphatidylserine decarboxylase [Elusimicrobiota bacterium]
MSIVKEGYPFIAVPMVLGLALIITGIGYITLFFGILCVIAALFCLYFFRDPKIKITEGTNLVLSPCNGRVLEAGETENGKIIRVFLSVFDVHLQRSPIAGKVISVQHKPGKFLKAMEPTAHIENEQNIITISSENGTFIVKQIAGILARRCVSWVKPSDYLEKGDKIGLIKFSSQVDVIMPGNVSLKVKVGDKVVSGVTVFGEIK